jgi:glycosyltransferase involved in cell wall biosynthesis
MPGDLMWSYFRVLHDLADVSLVPTYFHQMQLRELGFNRTQTWARGVDCDLFSPKRRSSAWRRHLSDGEVKKTLLVYAGKLTAEKHIELLRPVIDQNPDCRLAIVGAGPESTWLRDYFEGSATIFTGYLDQGDLAEVYASADAFIHPATTTISPVTTLEAMASGLPVLAPHSAAILDFAVHGENALLFIPGDTDQASAYVREIASKPRLRTDLSRIARQTALGRNWHITLDELEDIYRRLADRATQPLVLQAFESLPLPQIHS